MEERRVLRERRFSMMEVYVAFVWRVLRASAADGDGDERARMGVRGERGEEEEEREGERAKGEE